MQLASVSEKGLGQGEDATAERAASILVLRPDPSTGLSSENLPRLCLQKELGARGPRRFAGSKTR